ncbi:MAG TPA: phosphoribosyltransferase family protein [Candidatus Saccharimonadales bacterium]|nr:phosphoribosyltransferase family protein [Candidatus Saccharimonadales bacterium]
MVVTTYEGIAKELIWRLKFAGAVAAAQDMAATVSLVGLSPMAVFVAVPSSSDRYRQRGYNQAELLMRAWQKDLPLATMYPLTRVGHQHQLGAGRQQRLHQLRTAFRVRSESVQGAHIILVDDVLTTGATLEAAAAALRQAGAVRIDALVFAQA